ncbi:predicted protein [Aspergillus nidulans FGSC A4]|uniref:Uncharacterized protein n=1 Tax=Emericella nidulans (strain FGSC A4 / ATCC 38163 / CBS 112.46 / NRRL 194 / M139) TaxID=227321 RepID=Q5B909_EMENI|nr:hypothetical protein [Aspergillus nidulans FGSC A4]EAA63542.1 predicted protein [Aspergillus nidulans FGSC A4]CBF83642.1 TPA: conserved hypothetical protein [Aspergillus nidulans FGSC A4]|eukprot:XP_660575.1 predicted protein [Aspergillus nidulans FGSC A4]
MEHLHSRMPYAQWRLQVFHQLFLSSCSSSPAFLSRRVHSNSSYNAEPSTGEGNKNNTNKIHDNASKTGSTKRLSQLLPQSPLITNPNPGRALRHRKKRLPTPDDLSEISNNPWAVALASPVRMCNVTGTRIPRALLTEWGLVEEPARESTPEPDPISAPASDSYFNAESNTQVHTPRPKRLENKVKDNKLWILPLSLLKDDVVKKEGKDNRPHLKFRMLDRNYILQTITNAERRKTKQKNFIANLIPHRWKPPLGPLNAEHQKRLAWRADMPDFVLGVKRREALKQLKHVSDLLDSKNKSHARWMSFDVQKPYSGKTLVEGLITEGLAGKEVHHGLETGVFLVLGDGSGSGAGDAYEPANFPESVALPGIDRKVPIFDLTRLLSQAELEEIRAYHVRFQKFGAFFKPSRQPCIDAVLALWNLEGYIREATS